MARTADELLEDQQQEEAEVEEVISEPDDDEVPYNPKNLPLGWDRKVRRLGISLEGGGRGGRGGGGGWGAIITLPSRENRSG